MALMTVESFSVNDDHDTNSIHSHGAGRRHGESVLVVDDVAEQRQVATVILTRLGYRAAAVSSGEEAVEYLKSNQADILIKI